MTQKGVRDGRLNIIDETPGLNTSERGIGVLGLTRIANMLETVAEYKRRDDPEKHTTRTLATFTRALIDTLTDPEGDAKIADLEAPTIISAAYETHDPMAGGHVKRVEADDDREHAEALKKAKVAFSERLSSSACSDEWEGTPISLDPRSHGGRRRRTRRDADHAGRRDPPILDGCPWCGERPRGVRQRSAVLFG